MFCSNAPRRFVLSLLRCRGGCKGERSVGGWVEVRAAHPVLWARRLRSSRAPGWFVPRETGSNTSLRCQQECGQSPGRAERGKEGPGCYAEVPATSSFWKLNEQSRQRRCGDGAAAHGAPGHRTGGAGPCSVPIPLRCLRTVSVLAFRAMPETHRCESPCASHPSSRAPLGTGRHVHQMEANRAGA